MADSLNARSAIRLAADGSIEGFGPSVSDLHIPATRLRALRFSQLFDQDNTADHIEATFALEGLLSEWSEAGASVESQDAVMNAAFAIARRRSVTPSSTTAVQLVVSAARELMKALGKSVANEPASGDL